MKQTNDALLRERTRWDRLAPEGTLRRQVLQIGKWAGLKWARPWLDRTAEAEPNDARPAPLDLYDDAAVLRLLAEHFLPGGSPQESESGMRGAARWVIGLLRRRPEVRERFPYALSAGVEGAYCRWLCREGAAAFELSPSAVNHIQEAFRARLGDRVRQAFEFRPDLREAFPLATTPSSRAEMFLWLQCFGRAEQRFQVEEIWWFLLECADDPARELARCYLLNPGWQQSFPLALSVFGQQEFLGWLGEQYELGEPHGGTLDLSEALRPADQLRLYYAQNDALQQLAPRAFEDADETTRLLAALESEQGIETRVDDQWWRRLAADDAEGLLERTGVNVLGHFCCPIGLRTTVLTNVRALERAGVRTSCRNVPADANIDFPNGGEYLGLELFDVTLIHVQPEPFFRECYARSALAPREDVYRVAVWFWELERVPGHWGECCDVVDEVWAPTEFVAQALRGAVPVPVVRMLPGLELGEVAELPRSHWGLDPSKYTFLFMFDMGSVMQRKNPLGLIRAYRRAFRHDDDVALVIKLSRGNTSPEELAQLEEAAREAGVTLIDQVMSHEQSCELINACDCYVSLHRSEGLGLTLAEAMLLGKPAIATRYSGNLDFMTAENSLLVDYEPVPLERDYPPYAAGAWWAEPCVEHAVDRLRWVHEHRDEARALGSRGQADVRKTLSVESAGRRMADRLGEIRAARMRNRLGTRGDRSAEATRDWNTVSHARDEP